MSTLCLPSFDFVPRLRVPEKQRSANEKVLRDLGLNPTIWFACFYWREPGYQNRPAHQQPDILDPAPYIEAILYVVEELGGQVGRLGHPTGTVPPDHPSIIDLAKIDDNLMTQIAAISRARFFVSSCSGPLTFGPGFGVPTAVTDNIDISGGWNDHDILLTQRIIGPNGQHYHQKSALEAGLLKVGIAKKLSQPEHGYRYLKNSASDLRHVTELLHERTKDCPEWRDAHAHVAPGRAIKGSYPFPCYPR